MSSGLSPQAVAEALQLRHIVLYDANVERGSATHTEPGRVDMSGQLTPRIEEDEPVAIIMLELRTSMSNSDDDEIASIRQRYAAVYDFAEGLSLTVDDLRSYAESSTVFQVHPFAREFLLSLTHRLGIAPYTLPTLTKSSFEIIDSDD